MERREWRGKWRGEWRSEWRCEWLKFEDLCARQAKMKSRITLEAIAILRAPELFEERSRYSKSAGTIPRARWLFQELRR